MFSLAKLLVLVLIIAGVIGFFRAAGSLKRAQDAAARRATMARQDALKTEDLLKCPTCGAYVPASGCPRCGTTDLRPGGRSGAQARRHG